MIFDTGSSNITKADRAFDDGATVLLKRHDAEEAVEDCAGIVGDEACLDPRERAARVKARQ